MGQITDITYEKLVREDAKVHYLTCAETAKLVRAALKDAFPGVTFSVKSKTYSGGASITVVWTDGPTTQEVEQVSKCFEGADFDGMIDLKTYKKPTAIEGQLIHFGADFVFSDRDLSYDLLLECAEAIANRYGVQAPEVCRKTYHYRNGKSVESVWIERGGEPLDKYADGSVANYASTASDKALQLAYATSKYQRPE